MTIPYTSGASLTALYHCISVSYTHLCGLGRMYAGGGELTENIDDVGGVGTAEFASKAIDI